LALKVTASTPAVTANPHLLMIVIVSYPNIFASGGPDGP
jgi:hypothetical protein